MTEKDARPSPPAAAPRDPARERLAAALRENLHRRKAQARARRAPAPGEPPCHTGDTDVENR